MAAYRVKAGAVVAVVGGSDRYFEKGVVLPEGVENIDHLKAVGLVEEVESEAEVAPVEPEPEKTQARKPATK